MIKTLLYLMSATTAPLNTQINPGVRVKRFTTACLISVAGSLAQANTVVLNPGATLTTGPSPSQYSIFSAHHNPANASFAIREGEQFRFNYGPTLGLGTELGDVSNFADEVDDLIDILDDPSLAEDSQATLDRFNAVLGEIGDEGYLKINNGLALPLLPLYWSPNFFSGTVFLEADVNTQISGSILDAELTFDDQNQSFATATSVYLKSGIQTRLAMGYSQELFNRNKFEKYGGRLYGGFKINLISLELSKQVMRLQYLDGKDIEDVLEDEYENNLETTVNMGLDAGLLWAAEKYQVGVTLTNINAPVFDYGTIGSECEAYAEGSIQRNNCDAAYYFGAQEGEIQLKEKHTKHPALTLDGAYFFTPKCLVTGSLELAAYDDIVGYENQWLHIATAYEPESYWWPAARIGYHKNLAGSKLSSASIGFTFFGVLTIDLEKSFEEITVDGTSGPRTTGFSIGFQEKF